MNDPKLPPSPKEALDILYKYIGKLKLERDEHGALTELYRIVSVAIEPKKP